MLIEANDEWQDSDRRYLSEQSMALLTPPAPTLLEPKPAAPTTASRKEIRYGIVALRAEQPATSYTSPGDAIQPRDTSS